MQFQVKFQEKHMACSDEKASLILIRRNNLEFYEHVLYYGNMFTSQVEGKKEKCDMLKGKNNFACIFRHWITMCYESEIVKIVIVII